MAAIDKCYVDNYSDYQQFKEWAKDKSFVTPRGNKICISDYIFDLEKFCSFEGNRQRSEDRLGQQLLCPGDDRGHPAAHELLLQVRPEPGT